MALSKIQAESMNLADTYAFSGTVSGSGMVLLSTITASADDEIDFTGLFTSAYRDYELIGSNIHTSGDGVSVGLRVFVGGSIKSDSHYRYSRLRNYSGDATARGSAELTDTEFAQFGGRSMGNATGEHSNFRMIIYNPLGTDNFKTIESITTQVDAGTDSWNMLMSGHYKNGVTALTGIRFFVASGNIATGIFKLYGRK
jgi:hypothetical protein